MMILKKRRKLFIYILILWRKMTPTNMTTFRGMISRKATVGRGRWSLILIQGQKEKKSEVKRMGRGVQAVALKTAPK